VLSCHAPRYTNPVERHYSGSWYGRPEAERSSLLLGFLSPGPRVKLPDFIAYLICAAVAFVGITWLSFWLTRKLWHFVLWAVRAAAASCHYPGLFFRHASFGHGATILFFYWLHAFAHFRASRPLPPRSSSLAFVGTGALVGCGLLFTTAFYFINAGSTRVAPECTGLGGLGPLLFLAQALLLVFEHNKKAGKGTVFVGLAHGIVKRRAVTPGTVDCMGTPKRRGGRCWPCWFRCFPWSRMLL
jgi:hypothetical protein